MMHLVALRMYGLQVWQWLPVRLHASTVSPASINLSAHDEKRMSDRHVVVELP